MLQETLSTAAAKQAAALSAFVTYSCRLGLSSQPLVTVAYCSSSMSHVPNGVIVASRVMLLPETMPAYLGIKSMQHKTHAAHEHHRVT